MEMLQGVWKQRLRPRAVVGYGVKIFLPSPPNYVTRSPGNNVVEILQREVSWARVPEIVLQNDRALFRPKSKKMTGNPMITFNVVTS